MPMDEEFSKMLDLKALLRGNLQALSDRIGRNYARRERIRLKAILACANLRRKDLINELHEILKNGTEKEKIHAQWAICQLEREEKQ